MAMSENSVFETAVRYLQRYAAPTEQLRRVMLRKIKRAERFGPVPPEAPQWVEKAVARCVSYGYVDDRLYTESRVRSLRRQGRSSAYISQYLEQKGVARALVRECLPRDEDVELQAAIRHVARKRLGRDTSFEARQKDLARMARAGYGMAVAQRALQSVGQEGDADGDEG